MAVVCVSSYSLDKATIITSDIKEANVREDIMRLKYDFQDLIYDLIISSQFSDERCENLKGKPKIFLFPTCRGQRKDFGIIGKVCWQN